MTLDQAKAWLRVESGDDEDALITALIPAARARGRMEHRPRLCHPGLDPVAGSRRRWLHRHCRCRRWQACTSVTLYAADDTATVLATDQYQVDVPGGACAAERSASRICAPSMPSPSPSPPVMAMPAMCRRRSVPPSCRSSRRSMSIAAAMPRPRRDSALALLAPYRAIKL